MKEYIEREALLKRMEERLASLRKEYGNFDHYTDGYEEGCIAVEDAPAADVVERKRGEWVDISCLIRDPDGDWVATQYKCPFCGRTEWKKEPFCNCGADMRGEKHEP